MRIHKTKTLPQYNVVYRPLTVDPGDESFIIESGTLYRHQIDYVYLMAMFDSLGVDSVRAKVDCPVCHEDTEFDINRNNIMVVEFEDAIFGKDIKLSMHPYISGQEEIPDLIDFVVIDGEQIKWEDCNEKEKEAVLDSIDYETFKSISMALNKPTVTANIPVRCSCGHEMIVPINGLDAFLKVV